MLCHICNEEKLSKEFVYENLSELCEHPGLFCMQCALAAVNGKCPYKDCDVAVPADLDQLEEYKYILDSLYPDIVGVECPEVPVVNEKSSHGWIISVVLLTGERIVLSVLPSTTVLKLKESIQQKNGTPAEKQKLIFKEKELEAYRQDGSVLTLQHYGIQNNSTICLLVMLYTIPQHFSNVVFDLHWGYPYISKYKRTTDFLDASCLVFRGTKHIQTIDFRHRSGSYFSGIVHSGDDMDEHNKIGHHTINVNLQSIPGNVTHLFFTLSAWGSPTIQHFPNPSLKFFEASNRNKDLCSTSFNHACHSQAVIMCSVSRKSGFWQIFGSGKLSGGNARDYQPIIQTIQQLIASGV